MQVKWDYRFLNLAKHIATWSKDPSSQVGAVLVNENRIVVGMGYNGFPRGVYDLAERYNDRETKYKFVVHAEVNAILAAGSLARGCSLYVYPTLTFPNICSECAKHAIQAGVKEIIGFLPPEDLPPKSWASPELVKIVTDMLNESGVRFRGVLAI